MSGPVYLYAFGREGGPFKVGYSRQLGVRSAQILAYEPGASLSGDGATMLRTIPLASVEDARVVEAAAHRLLAPYRVQTRWGGAKMVVVHR